MNDIRQPEVWSVAELREQLRGPYGLEEIAQNTVPVVVVTLDGRGRDDSLTELSHLLRSVRAVSVGVVESSLALMDENLSSNLDILLAPPELCTRATVPTTNIPAALAAVGAAVGANPHAAVALVELLRQGSYNSVPQGLVLESLTYSMLQSGPEFAAWLRSRGPASLPPDVAEPVMVTRDRTSLDVTLNRPDRSNAFTAALRDQLVDALRVAASDPSIKHVALRGSGRSFSSGGDLAEFGSLPDPATAHAIRLERSPAWWIDHLSDRVTVHLHGACIGGGIEVAAFAKTVVADPTTVVQLPEVAMGLIPGAGGTVSLARRIGPQRTAYLAVTGSELGAQDALSWGLVDRVEVT